MHFTRPLLNARRRSQTRRSRALTRWKREAAAESAETFRSVAETLEDRTLLAALVDGYDFPFPERDLHCEYFDTDCYGDSSTFVTQEFGVFSSEHGGYHAGDDIAGGLATDGMPVAAIANGTVVDIRTDSGIGAGWGNALLIEHEELDSNGNINKRYSIYAHLSRFADGVQSNAAFERGDIVGYVGSTGSSSAPHLHFAISTEASFGLGYYPGGIPPTYIDPSKYIAARRHVGFLDSQFGNSGTVVTDIGPHAGSYDLAVQKDGKIVAVGAAVHDSNGNEDFAIARYNADGTIDSGFGDGGVVFIDFAGRDDSARSVRIQSDGKIVVAGVARVNFANCGIVRLNADGTRDTSFGNNGIVSMNIDGSTGTSALALELMRDGRMVVGGTVKWRGTNTSDFAVARFLNNGTVDTTFGAAGVSIIDISGTRSDIPNGWTRYDELHSLSLQHDGKVVAVGKTSLPPDGPGTAIVRYNSDGFLDDTFGDGGIVSLKGKLYEDITVLSAGDIVVGGNVGEFAIARLSPGGSLVSSFGHNGIAVVPFAVRGNSTATSLAIQSDGKIIAAGIQESGNPFAYWNFAVARFLPNGSLDPAFGNGGTESVPGGFDFAYDAAIQPDGDILVGGTRRHFRQGSDTDFLLARFIGDDGPFTPQFPISDQFAIGVPGTYDGDGNDVEITLESVSLGQKVTIFAGPTQDALTPVGQFTNTLGESPWTFRFDIRPTEMPYVEHVAVGSTTASFIVSARGLHPNAHAYTAGTRTRADPGEEPTTEPVSFDDVANLYHWSWTTEGFSHVEDNLALAALLNGKKNIFLTHGWNDRLDFVSDDEFMRLFALDFKDGRSSTSLSNYNVFAIDWWDGGSENGSDPNGKSSWYDIRMDLEDAAISATNGILASNAIADHLVTAGVNPEDVFLIGHSNGAGFMANLARLIHLRTGKRVAELAALDAPYFTASYWAVQSAAPSVERLSNYYMELPQLGFGAPIHGADNVANFHLNVRNPIELVGHSVVPQRYVHTADIEPHFHPWGFQDSSFAGGTPYPPGDYEESLVPGRFVRVNKNVVTSDVIKGLAIAGYDFVSKWQQSITPFAGNLVGINSEVWVSPASSFLSIWANANSPIVASVEVDVPADTDLLSFDLNVFSAEYGETLLVQVNSDLLTQIDLKPQTASNGQHFDIWIDDYAGQPATLTFYMPSDEPSDAEFLISNIEFASINQFPIPNESGPLSISEGEKLEFTTTGTDPDDDDIIFSIDENAPAGAMIDPESGVFTWTPTEAQGPETYQIVVYYTDDGPGNLVSWQTIEVTVDEVNQYPIVDPISDRMIDEEKELRFFVTASDADLPENRLTYSLAAGAPVGAQIDPNTGEFRWTPTEAQGVESLPPYEITVVVTDDGAGSLTDEFTFKVTVNEVNTAPQLDPITDKSIDEQQKLCFLVTASDADLPENGLTFSLTSAAALGATIDPNTGEFCWTPSETQGIPSRPSYEITVVVTDDGEGSLKDEFTFKVTVNEVNLVPVIVPISDKAVDEQEGLSFFVAASDSDSPADKLTFSLEPGAPDGAAIDSDTGEFTWTPTEAQGRGTYQITVVVTDDGSPALSDQASFNVTVNEVNLAPVLDLIPDKSVGEETELRFFASASDPDIPANRLTFSLAPGAPSGAAIDADTGEFTWTPTEADGGGTYPIKVIVADDGTSVLTDMESFDVTVNEVNKPPRLDPIGDKKTFVLRELRIPVIGRDDDRPATTLTYSLISGPPGALVDPATGEFVWTPAADQHGTFDVRVGVSDGIAPPVSSNTFSIVVMPLLSAPHVFVPVNPAIDSHPLVTWNPVDNATHYEVEVFSRIRQQVVATEIVTGISWNVTPALRVEDEPYEMRVRALENGELLSEWSVPEEFEIVPPPAPIFTGPVALPGTGLPTWTWVSVIEPNVSGKPFTYRLVVIDVATGQTVINENGLSTTHWDAQSSLPDGLYQAFITGINDAGDAGVTGGPWEILINTTGHPSNLPTPTGPGRYIYDATPTITWRSVPNAVSYEVLIYNLHRGTKIIHVAGVTGTSLTTDPLPVKESYQVFVKAHLPGGGSTNFAGPLVFSVNLAKPPLPSPQIMTPPELVGPGRPVRWKGLAGNSEYVVQFYSTSRGQLIYEAKGIHTTRHVLPAVLAADRYEFYVRGTDLDGAPGSWSQLDFTVVATVSQESSNDVEPDQNASASGESSIDLFAGFEEPQISEFVHQRADNCTVTTSDHNGEEMRVAVSDDDVKVELAIADELNGVFRDWHEEEWWNEPAVVERDDKSATLGLCLGGAAAMTAIRRTRVRSKRQHNHN